MRISKLFIVVAALALLTACSVEPNGSSEAVVTQTLTTTVQTTSPAPLPLFSPAAAEPPAENPATHYWPAPVDEELAYAVEEPESVDGNDNYDSYSSYDVDTPVDAGTSTYFENCSAVRAAGAAPIYAGSPGYGDHLDRDGDGVACET